jgi:hypothetical protein
VSPITAERGIIELDREQGREFLGKKTRESLDMTLDEFEVAYDNGELDLADPQVAHLVMLLPFAR